MEHLEQSVMWAGTNWMLKLLAVNLATTPQVSVGSHGYTLYDHRNSDHNCITPHFPF